MDMCKIFAIHANIVNHLITVFLYVYMFYFVLIDFINLMYDITYIGLHAY